jgi:hypothetical protein
MTKVAELKGHRDGIFETVKFAKRKPEYYHALDTILNLGYNTEDYLHHFPAFVGQMTLWRALTLYELYKKTLGIAGHIADVGVYKGASTLLFAKLVQIFEPEALTMVHGFDWFKGTQVSEVSEESHLQVEGSHVEDEKRVRDLVSAQGLDHVVKIHRLDVATQMDEFFGKHPHLRFKLVFLDSGTYEVVASAIRAFWPRITPGGILIFDQYNHEVAPGETRAVTELLPNEKVETLPNSWMPNAYIQKPWSR